MSTLDEVTKEKQRVTEALARIDLQRENLAGKLNELEATERVLARYSKGRSGTKAASAKPSATVMTESANRPSRRQRGASKKSTGDNRNSPGLGDRVLALATGKTQQQIAAACKGARPNHVGAAISRHKRLGRIVERDGKLYAA